MRIENFMEQKSDYDYITEVQKSLMLLQSPLSHKQDFQKTDKSSKKSFHKRPFSPQTCSFVIAGKVQV